MQQMNLHKNKLLALAEAAIAMIGMFLVWTREKYPAQLAQQQFNFGQQEQGFANAMTETTQNGFNSWGWLALIGILVVVAGTLFLNHMSYDYDNRSRYVAIAGFALIALGALIYFLRLNSVAKDIEQAAQQRGISITISSGIGLWSTLLAGLIGAAWVSGLLNKLNMSPATTHAGYGPHPYQNNPYQQQPYGPQPPYPPQGNYPPQNQPNYQQQNWQQPPPYPNQQPPYPAQQPPQEGYNQNPQQGNPPYPQQQPAQPNYQQGVPPPPPPPPGTPPANPYI